MATIKDRRPGVTHRIMSAVKSKNTRPEITLRKELFRRGFRYRVNVKTLKGKPDIVLSRAKIAIFVDGDFWHGHNWVVRGYGSHEAEMKRYSKFWQEKIERNMLRDKQVNKTLSKAGWKVLRYWESDIKKDVSVIADDISWWYHFLLN